MNINNMLVSRGFTMRKWELIDFLRELAHMLTNNVEGAISYKEIPFILDIM